MKRKHDWIKWRCLFWWEREKDDERGWDGLRNDCTNCVRDCWQLPQFLSFWIIIMTLSLFLFYFLQVSHFFHFISPFYNNFYSHNSIVSMFISVLILFSFTPSFFFPQHRKYVQRGFGECPRMLCRGQPVLPVSTEMK